MDPESGLDDVRNLGISGGKVRAVSSDSLTGKQTIEARGMVVAPGFIDLHEHGQEARNYQFQAHDGVTTSLELELGTYDVDKWYAAREGKSLINFGVSAGHIPMRIRVMTGQEVPSLSAIHTPEAEAANHRELTAEEFGKLREGPEARRACGGDGDQLHAWGVALGDSGDVPHGGEIPCASTSPLAVLLVARTGIGNGRARGSNRSRGYHRSAASRGPHHQHGA
jgi:hypothetical protein